ncbi:hypothetical protein L218DRAFT_40022 [Marasmius fiardii PR-910]|nr:hypothetical protein L218DRAFT_40022 [Marasmius fiardii PR-910]
MMGSGTMADPSARKEVFEKIVYALDHQQLVAHLDVVSATLLVYETIVNLHLEIQYIWTRKWSLFTVLYIIQRYLPFFDTTVLILHRKSVRSKFEHSLLHLKLQHRRMYGSRYTTFANGFDVVVHVGFYVVGIALSEIVLTIRVWAVWKRSTLAGIGLLVFFLACWVPDYALFARFLSSMEFATPPLPKFRGCFIAAGSHILFVCWVLMMVYDSGMLVMILIPGVAAYRSGGRSELMKTIYRDGVIYYAYLFLISLINVIVILILPPDLVHLLNSFERVLHSVLTSRAILHIRQAVATQHYMDYVLSHEISEISFPTIPSIVQDQNVTVKA